MQVNTGKLQILIVAAMLVLVSGGVVAYAQGQSAPSAGAPAAVLPVVLAGSDSNSTTTLNLTSTTSTTANQTLCQPPTPVKVGRLVLPITATGASGSASSSISLSNGRGCLASITSVGGIFNVQIVLRFAKPVTQYNVVLVANGTSYTLGSLVTAPAGNGQIDNQVLLKTGTYVVSIQIYDTSSNPGTSTLVLQTGQGTITSSPLPATTNTNNTNSTNSGQPPFPGGPQGPQGGQGGQSGHHK
jgi:hypothetical protein